MRKSPRSYRRRSLLGFCHAPGMLTPLAATGFSLAVCFPLNRQLVASSDMTPVWCLAFLTAYGMVSAVAWGLGRLNLATAAEDRLAVRAWKGIGRVTLAVANAIRGGGMLPAFWTLLVLLYYTAAYFHSTLPPI